MGRRLRQGVARLGRAGKGAALRGGALQGKGSTGRMTVTRSPATMGNDIISAKLARLKPDELRVAEHIIDRLLLGQERYGELSLERYPRQPLQEATEELLDACIYMTIWLEQGTK